MRMAKTLYFDCISGASGDMILASLVDLGVPVRYLNKELGRMKIPGLSVSAARVKRNGLMCSQMKMKWRAPREYRYLHDILHTIRHAKYGSPIQEKCESVLHAIAHAEAHAHGISVDHVHFHEIGAVDTIVDIVGACLAINYLKVDEIRFSTLTEGHGTIQTEHGRMPVPAPATARLIMGFRVKRLDIPTELLTPTGAALLTMLGRQSAACPEGIVLKTGNGCGTKTFAGHPNYLRAMLLETAEASEQKAGDTVSVLETDMDHISGEIMGHAADLLMKQGALDVSWTPVFMKKGRPAYRLTVICAPEKSGSLVDCIMLHTRTLGVRIQTAKRVVADRAFRETAFMGKKVREKKCGYKGSIFSKPEYEDLARISREKSIPLIALADRFTDMKNKIKI